MGTRITVTDLEGVVRRINRMAGVPEDAKLWNREGDRNIATVGMYHLDGAYGGWTLYQMANESGGVREIVGQGYVSKRELFGLMQAYISGQLDRLDMP